MSTLLTTACSGDGNPIATSDDYTATELPTTTEKQEVQEVVPVGPSMQDLVTELKPVAAWDCDGEGGVADLVSGKPAVLTEAELVDGHYGKGIRTFSKEKSYLDLGVGTLGNLVNGKDAVTVSMWVLPYLNNNEHYRLFHLNVNGDIPGIYATYRNDRVVVYARSSASSGLASKTFEFNLDDGTIHTISSYTNEGRWQHLTFVIDFKANDISLFVNGNRALCFDTVNFGGAPFTMGSPTEVDSFGGTPARRSSSFNGVMDSMMVFDRALTTAEVKKIYGERKTAESPATDQKLIEEILERMGNNTVFREGHTVLISKGMFEKNDAADYSAEVINREGKAYVPAAAARLLPVTTGVQEATVDGKQYFELASLCAANGKTLLSYNGLHVAMDAASSLDPAADAALLDRVLRLFDEHIVTDIVCGESRVAVSETGKTYTYGQLSGTVKYCSGPSITTQGDSIFLSMDTNGGKVFVFESTDGGKSFAFRSLLEDFHFASIFSHNGALYLIGCYTDTNGAGDHIGITKSTDGGKSWSAFTHFAGPGNKGCHGAPNTVLIANGRIYRAFGISIGSTFSKGCEGFVVSAPVGADLLLASSWTVSNSVAFTLDMFTTHENGSKIPSSGYFEEGNVVQRKDGSLAVIYGIKAVPVFAYALVMELSADGRTLTFNKSDKGSVIKFPGGNSKFNVTYDERTGKYLALVNENTDDRYFSQRSVLTLVVSDDMINWTTVGTVLSDHTVMNDYISLTQHGFQYVDFVIDGDDIIMAVREAIGDSHCYHNANYTTFYRIENYAQYVK